MGEHVAGRRREPVADPVGDSPQQRCRGPRPASAGVDGAQPNVDLSWLCVPIQESRSTISETPAPLAEVVIPQIRQAAIGGLLAPRIDPGQHRQVAVNTLPRNAVGAEIGFRRFDTSSDHHATSAAGEKPRSLEVGPHGAVFAETAEVRRLRRER